MDLILLRHGEAEDATHPGDPAEDAARRLTDDGKTKLSRSLPQLSLLLDDKKQLVIWTSPLVRARETAEILRDSLDLRERAMPDDLSQHEFNATGDWPASSRQPRRSIREPAWSWSDTNPTGVTGASGSAAACCRLKKAPPPVSISILLPGIRWVMARPSGKDRASCSGLSSPGS